MFMKNIHKKMGVSLVEDAFKRIHAKDGNTHIAMFDVFSSMGAGKDFCYNKRPSEELDAIISRMQQQGFEILNIQFTSAEKQGWSNDSTLFHVMITYK